MFCERLKSPLLLIVLVMMSAVCSADDIDWDQSREFWAFRQPVKPAVPEVVMKNWARSDIDRFVLAGMENAGLVPADEADRRILVRRVYYDLSGLPPTAEEVEGFVTDTRSDAFEHLIDRLLSDSAYGERLASIWLNIARYAEDQAHQVGNDKKFFYPHAHRYRQWVIAAFNRDVPYDQFIRLQLAADRMGDQARGDLAALGFLGLGPQYYNRGRLDVMAEEWEDAVDVVTRGFLALTVACARCHQHKHDPFTMRDYYALAGVFASTEVDKREIEFSDGSKVKAHLVKEGKVKNLPVFRRGNVEDKGKEVPRRFLEVLAGQAAQPFSSGSGRAELAEVIADPKNPLTARVMVNRLWQMIFGAGLVATTSNFGKLGERPTHPELLDYLALRFVEDGWSIKNFLRAMVLSSTYRQSSFITGKRRSLDEQNQWWSYMERRRLSAEMLRDSLLMASGELERGDSGEASKDLKDSSNRRRTVYARISRKELDPFLAMFDYPDPNVHVSHRDQTVTPAQKLFLLNSPFVIARSGKVAETVSGVKTAEGVERIYRKVLSRGTRDNELEAALRFLGEKANPGHADWTRFVQTLMMSNEFLFRD